MGKPNTLRRLPMADVNSALASTKNNITAAAQQLGITRRTLQRWLRAGKVGKVTKPARRRRAGTSRSRTPEGWRKWVLRTYELDATERGLLDLAVSAKTIAEDVNEPKPVRLAASREYRALLKQLNFESAHEAEDQETEADTEPAAPARQFRVVGE
jgi:hypothetical protein